MVFPSRHSVLDYLEKTCRIYGFSESRAREILEIVQLEEEVYNRPIKSLSAGMHQRFVLAHALIHEPDLVVADEPTSNLDPLARNALLDLILKLQRDENTTFLISSHILPELTKVCESVSIINRGKVWAQGSVTDLLETFGIGVTRVSTDKSEVLANMVRKLGYIKRVEVRKRDIFFDIDQDKRHQLYEDVIRSAKEVGAKIIGIESGITSLEELFKLAMGKNREGI